MNQAVKGMSLLILFFYSLNLIIQLERETAHLHITVYYLALRRHAYLASAGMSFDRLLSQREVSVGYKFS